MRDQSTPNWRDQSTPKSVGKLEGDQSTPGKIPCETKRYEKLALAIQGATKVHAQRGGELERLC